VKINKDQKVAVGRALKGLEAQGEAKAGDVQSAELDGTPIDPAEALEAADQVAIEGQLKRADPGKLRKAEDKLEEKSEVLHAKLAKSKLGRAATAAMTADPERVAHDATLVVQTVDGKRIEVEIPVVHLKATEMLQKASITSEIGTMIPIAGHFVPAAASLISALGSLIARGVGEKELADAMMGTAKKHLALTGAKMVPGVGLGATAIAVLEDRKNLRDLDNPSVDAVINLRPKAG
jgi:hypothetical protein